MNKIRRNRFNNSSGNSSNILGLSNQSLWPKKKIFFKWVILFFQNAIFGFTKKTIALKTVLSVDLNFSSTNYRPINYYNI